MRPSLSRASVTAWLMALAATLILMACGGGQAPILGVGGGVGTAPQVSETSPEAQNPVLTDIAINTRVTATFSKAMNPATLNSGTFILACPAGTPVSGSVSYDASNRVSTFVPSANLPLSTLCVATVTTGVQDTTGIPMQAAFVWSFVTGATADATAPTVTSVVPAQDAVAATNTAVTATFSESMAPATIGTGSFTLKTTVGDSPIVGTVAYSVAARTATFTPTSPSPLPNNTSFTATVGNTVTDLAGNAMVANKVWTFTTSALADTTPPTVVSVNPLDTSVAICINKTVTATFSEAMDPLTLSTATVKLAPSSDLNATVTAVVTYDTVNHIASINPSANLAASTAYTATVVGAASGAKDLAGNALVSDKVWQFTTGTSECQLPVPLGTSSNFAILASAAITNIPTSIITGDVGLTPDTGSGITGFSSPGSCPEIVGRLYAVDAAGPACALIDATLLSNAKTDALAAFVNANNAARGTPTPISTNLAGLTLYPGLYQSGTTLDFSAGGSLTLDAQGDANAVFVIRSATAITTLSTSQVVLSGSAKASNVFWIAGSAITLGANSIMKGTMVASTAITLQTGANLEGRALNQGAAAAAIACDACTITVPTP